VAVRRSWRRSAAPGCVLSPSTPKPSRTHRCCTGSAGRLVGGAHGVHQPGVGALGGIRHRLRPRGQARCAVAWRCCSPRKTPGSPGRRELLGDLNGQLRALDERMANYDARSTPPVPPTSAAWHRPADRQSAGRRGHRWQAIRQRPADGRKPGAHATGAQQWGQTAADGDHQTREPLRTIHAARTVLRHAEGKTDRLSRWTLAVQARRGANVAAVALANQLARIDNSITCRLVLYKGHSKGRIRPTQSQPKFQSPRSSPLIPTCGSEFLIKRLVPPNYFPDFEMFGHPRSRSRPKDPQGLCRHFE